MQAFRDIHLPSETISWWPLAPGWWGLLLLLLLLFVVVVPWCWQRWRNKRSQRLKIEQLQGEILEELARIRLCYEADAQASDVCAASSVLLRRICLSCFEREQHASLYGQPWLDYLNGKALLADRCGALLLSASYNPNAKAVPADIHRLLDAVEQWAVVVIQNIRK